MANNVTIKIKRGLEENRTNYTPAEGELILTTDNLELFVGDGSTAGGLKVDSNTFIKIIEKGVANGVATLDDNGKIPTSQIPSLALTDVIVCDNEDDQVNSDTQIGDVCIRTDEHKSYIRISTDNGDMSDWTELESPEAVTSVNGQTGTVVLAMKDIDDVNSDLAPNDQDMLVYDGNNEEWTTISKSDVGRTKFIALDDTPMSYSGNAGKFTRVSDDETAIVFDDTLDGGKF